jgi:uncharacterized membrane protein
MLRSILLALIAGARSMTPLAAVSLAAWRGRLPADSGAPALLGHPLVAAGTAALAFGELLGDKMPSAPDRIIAPGLAARIATGAVAAAALSPRRDRPVAALLGATFAVAAAHLSFRRRLRAMRHHGQTPTGLVEDALVLGATALVMRGA